MVYIYALNTGKKVKQIVDNAIISNNYNSDYMYYSSSIIPHPQKSRADALKITLTNVVSGNPEDKLDVILDDYEIVRTEKTIESSKINHSSISIGNEPIEDKVIQHINEQECLKADPFFTHLLHEYMRELANIHGKNYLQSSIQKRQHHIDSLKGALAYTKKKQDKIYDSPISGNMTEQDFQKIKAKLVRADDIINCLEKAIYSQSIALDFLQELKDSESEKQTKSSQQEIEE